MNIEDRLKELMRERGLTTYTLAKRSNLSWNTINNLFSKKSKPTITTLEMLCQGLGITLVQFFDTSGSTVSLTAEQELLLQRWASLTDCEKNIINDLLNYMSNQKGEEL